MDRSKPETLAQGWTPFDEVAGVLLGISIKVECSPADLDTSDLETASVVVQGIILGYIFIRGKQKRRLY